MLSWKPNLCNREQDSCTPLCSFRQTDKTTTHPPVEAAVASCLCNCSRVKRPLTTWKRFSSKSALTFLARSDDVLWLLEKRGESLPSPLFSLQASASGGTAGPHWLCICQFTMRPSCHPQTHPETLETINVSVARSSIYCVKRCPLPAHPKLFS